MQIRSILSSCAAADQIALPMCVQNKAWPAFPGMIASTSEFQLVCVIGNKMVPLDNDNFVLITLAQKVLDSHANL
jgi:hypothetical protein